MTIQKNRALAWLLAAVFLLISLVPAGLTVKAEETGTVTVKVGYYVQPVAKDQILNRLNEIRKQACDQGVEVEGKVLTPDDYVPLTWSKEMEEIAYTRAMEASVSYTDVRPNGQSWNTVVSTGGLSSEAENLGYIGDIMNDIEEWYKESLIFGNNRKNFLNIINPKYVSVGLGVSAVTTAEFSTQKTDETQIYTEDNWVTTNMEILPSKIHMSIPNPELVVPGDQFYLALKLGSLWVEDAVSWTSSDPSILKIDPDGLMTGLKGGTATITAAYAGATASCTIKVVAPSWKKDARGWYYDLGDGTRVRNAFWQIDGKVYYFDADGYMVTGWVKVNSNWYYMLPSGARASGWQQVDGKWYFLDPSTGVMQTGWLQRGATWYYLYPNGMMATGWTKVNNVWYYMNANGAMQTGWLQLGNVWYYLHPNGAMATGWTKVKDAWYYMESNGKMKSEEWLTDKNKKYYLTKSGRMATGWLKLDDKWYYMDEKSGAMYTGWVKVKDYWYYMNSDGVMQTGWITYKNNKYYLYPSGKMATGWLQLDGYWYYMDPTNGKMTTGLQTIKGKKYYMSVLGVMQTGWRTINGKRYYFGHDGAAFANDIYRIDGVNYAFDEEGVLADYVLNNVTKEFHLVDCTLVSRIYPAYRSFSAKTRAELISEGYKPCIYCLP